MTDYTERTIQKVDLMLDPDAEGFDTLEILMDNDKFMTALKDLLGCAMHRGDERTMPMHLVIHQAQLSNQLKKVAERVLCDLVDGES